MLVSHWPTLMIASWGAGVGLGGGSLVGSYGGGGSGGGSSSTVATILRCYAERPSEAESYEGLLEGVQLPQLGPLRFSLRRLQGSAVAVELEAVQRVLPPPLALLQRERC